MSGESGQLWPLITSFHYPFAVKRGNSKNYTDKKKKKNFHCVFVKASVKSSLRFKMGNASIIFHHHIVWANWSLCLNNVKLGSIFPPPPPCTFSTSPASFVHTRRRQLRSVLPSLKNMVESTADDTEQRSHQLPFMLPAVTLPQTSTRFRSAPS